MGTALSGGDVFVQMLGGAGREIIKRRDEARKHARVMEQQSLVGQQNLDAVQARGQVDRENERQASIGRVQSATRIAEEKIRLEGAALDDILHNETMTMDKIREDFPYVNPKTLQAAHTEYFAALDRNLEMGIDVPATRLYAETMRKYDWSPDPALLEALGKGGGGGGGGGSVSSAERRAKAAYGAFWDMGDASVKAEIIATLQGDETLSGYLDMLKRGFDSPGDLPPGPGWEGVHNKLRLNSEWIEDVPEANMLFRKNGLVDPNDENAMFSLQHQSANIVRSGKVGGTWKMQFGSEYRGAAGMLVSQMNRNKLVTLATEVPMTRLPAPFKSLSPSDRAGYPLVPFYAVEQAVRIEDPEGSWQKNRFYGTTAVEGMMSVTDIVDQITLHTAGHFDPALYPKIIDGALLAVTREEDIRRRIDNQTIIDTLPRTSYLRGEIRGTGPLPTVTSKDRELLRQYRAFTGTFKPGDNEYVAPPAPAGDPPFSAGKEMFLKRLLGGQVNADEMAAVNMRYSDLSVDRVSGFIGRSLTKQEIVRLRKAIKDIRDAETTRRKGVSQ